MVSTVKTVGDKVETTNSNILGSLVEDTLLELFRTGANHLDNRLLADQNVVLAAYWTSSDDADFVSSGALKRNLVFGVVHGMASETFSCLAV